MEYEGYSQRNVWFSGKFWTLSTGFKESEDYYMRFIAKLLMSRRLAHE